MKKLKKILLASVIIMAFGTTTNSVNASHISGGDIAYQCLGNDSFLITLNLFRDCIGIGMPTSYGMTFTNSCGLPNPTPTLNLINPGGYEISQLCPQDFGNSACSGGPLPGMQLYIYQAIVVMPPCNTWSFGWSTCCRNAAITNLVGSPSSYLEATMNSATDSCNSSPIFTAQPIPYVCVGQTVTYSYGVIEPDGTDSIAYSFTCGLSAASTCVPYQAPWTALQPITGITINPATGLITFTPTAPGNYVVTILVEEYDENGNLIGTVMRDIQFVVQNCSNQVPDPDDGDILNFASNGGTAVDTMSIELCEGDTFCFDFVINDPDTADVVTLSSTVTSALPGATFTFTPGNPATGTICWTAPPSQAFFNTFTVTAQDDACPIPGLQTYVYDVSVLSSTLAFNNQVICNNQTAQLSASGGSVFVWTSIAGDPINVGVNITCDTCQTPVVNPNTTTTYVVTSDLSGSCVNQDTVTVTVAPDFSYTTQQTASLGCLYEDIQMWVIPDSTGYSYNWTPSTYLDSTIINNPSASITTPGTYMYYVDITSPFGCQTQDTFTVVIDSFIQPQTIASISDTIICEGESVNLDAILTFPPIFCDYTIEMIDGFCDGWDGASMQVYLNGLLITPTAITNNNSCSESFTFSVQQGDVIDLNYTAGTSEFDHSYIVYDGTGGAIFSDGPNPTTGFAYSDTANCGIPTSGPFSYTWSPTADLSNASIKNPIASPSAPGTHTYQIVVTDLVGGCIDTTDVTVTVAPDLIPAIMGTPTTCANQTTPFNIGSTPSGGVWSGNGITNPANGEFTPAVAASLDTGGVHTVYYTVTNAAGCSFTDSTQVIVNPNPPAPQANGSLHCIGERVLIDASGMSGASYEWYLDQGLTTLAPGSGTSQLDYGFITANDTVYVIQVVNGCKSTPPNQPTVVVLNVSPSPVIVANPPTGPIPLDIDFNDDSGVPIWDNINWDFGNGESASDAITSNTYDVPGSYLVTLTGTMNGKTCIDTFTVVIDGVSGMYIPNVFTPNGDGVNDFFTLPLEGITQLEVQIYNRWGKKVFTYEHPGEIVGQEMVEVWDGEKHSDGVYYYVVVAKDVDGNEITHFYYNEANPFDVKNGEVYMQEQPGCANCLPVIGYITMMRGK